MAPEKPEPTTDYKPAEPILIDKFENDFVRDFEGKLPAITMAMPEGYARGTHLKMMVEVRIRNVRYEEGKNKELTRQHTFALENIELVGAYHPDELDPGVGGTAAASAIPYEDPACVCGDLGGHPGDCQVKPEPCPSVHPGGSIVCTQSADHVGMHANGSLVGLLW